MSGLFDMTDEEKQAPFDRYKEYNDQHFTGRQKIQMVIDEILKKYEELIDGDVVEIHSLDLHYNFEPEEQEQALKILQDNHKCIKYSVSKEGEKESAVEAWKVNEPYITDDEPWPHIAARSMKMLDKAIAAKQFLVEVLPNFREVIKELGTAQEVVYELRRSPMGNKLYLNDLKLSDVEVGFAPDELLEAAFSNKGRFVPETTFKNRSIINILNGLKLKKPLYDLFFAISKKGFRFNPTVTRADLAKMDERDTKLAEEEFRKLQQKLLSE